MKRKILTGILVLGLLATGAGLAVFAITNTQRVSASSSAAEVSLAGPNWNLGTDNEYLAEALGVTVDELAAAKTAAYEASIDQALELGLITESQAETLKSGTPGSLRGLGRLVSAEDLAQIDFHANLAEQLGITSEELTAAIQQAEQAKLDAAVAEGTISQEQADLILARQALRSSETFLADVKSGLQTAIENALSAGTITQAQADALLARLENVYTNGNMFGLGDRGRRGGMPGAGRHGWNGFGIQSPDSDAELEDTGDL